jgi:hypothetical protein
MNLKSAISNLRSSEASRASHVERAAQREKKPESPAANTSGMKDQRRYKGVVDACHQNREYLLFLPVRTNSPSVVRRMMERKRWHLKP